MSSDGLIIRIAEAARLTNDQAFEALAATFQGLLSISSPATYKGQPIEILISVNPPPQPKPASNAPVHPNISVNPPPQPNISVNPPPQPNISVNPPPQPNIGRGLKPPPVRAYADLVDFIADSADISVPAAGAALGVITQAIVEGGSAAGLRTYFEFEPPQKPKR